MLKEGEKMGERKMLATKVRHKHTENRKQAFETLRILAARKQTGAASSKEETFSRKAHDGNISKAAKHFQRVLRAACLLVKYLLQVS